MKESTKDVLKFLLGFIVVVLAFGGYKLLAVLECTCVSGLISVG